MKKLIITGFICLFGSIGQVWGQAGSENYQLLQVAFTLSNPNTSQPPSSPAFSMNTISAGDISSPLNSGNFYWFHPGFIVPGNASVNSQSIALQAGYQFVSSCIIPGYPDMLNVLENNLNTNLEFVRDENGNLLHKIGPQWINGIGDWNTTQGYLFKMSGADELDIQGQMIDPSTPMPLGEGYNFAAYLPSVAINALEAFASILGDELSFIRNMHGGVIQKIGNTWINGIGNAMPGEFYLVKLFEGITLFYPDDFKQTIPENTEPSGNFYFDGGNAADPVYTIFIEANEDIKIGSTILAYAEDKIVGSVKLTGENWKDNALPAFSTLNNGKGYKTGSPIVLKIVKEGGIYDLEYRMLNVDGAYTGNTYPAGDGIYSIVKASLAQPSNTDQKGYCKVSPNPAKDFVTISASSPMLRMVLLDESGKVLESYLNIQDNRYFLDMSPWQPGLYFFKIITKKEVFTEKLILQ